MSELGQRLAEVREEIAGAARAAGRDPASVGLVAVSKFHPAECVAEAFAAGQASFGESYVQEALAKMAQLPGLALDWHLVGGLQSNKAKYVAGRFGLIHSLDSAKLARALSRALSERAGDPDPGLPPRAPVQEVLIQVNLAGEEQKSGVPENEAQALAEEVLGLPGLSLSGLMILPPWDPDPELSRPYFSRLRGLRDRLARELGLPLPHLSMGMSGDFAVAVAEGATLVRVGTRIFGERPRPGQ